MIPLHSMLKSHIRNLLNFFTSKQTSPKQEQQALLNSFWKLLKFEEILIINETNLMRKSSNFVDFNKISAGTDTIQLSF